MIDVQPVVLEGGGIGLEPMAEHHHDGLEAAAQDGQLWHTAVPLPGGMRKYISDAQRTHVNTT